MRGGDPVVCRLFLHSRSRDQNFNRADTWNERGGR